MTRIAITGCAVSQSAAAAASARAGCLNVI